MVGIMVCDYWILRHRVVKLSDLYHPGKDGLYYFWHGVNWRAFVAWVVGWSYLLPGFAHAVTPSVIVPEACTNLYYLAFPMGFAVSFTVYFCLNKIWTPEGFGVKDDIDYYGTFTEKEAAKLGVAMMESFEGVVRDRVSVEEDVGKDDKFVGGWTNVTAV